MPAFPSTGAVIYATCDQNGWPEMGGTSESSPILPTVFALAGQRVAGGYPPPYPYAHAGSLFGITRGSGAGCRPSCLGTASAGYDGPALAGSPGITG